MNLQIRDNVILMIIMFILYVRGFHLVGIEPKRYRCYPGCYPTIEINCRRNTDIIKARKFYFIHLRSDLKNSALTEKSFQ